MEKLKKYSIELLASAIGDLIKFEDRDTENWEEVEICFAGMNAFISGVMYSDDESGEFTKADLDKVVLLFTDNDNQTDFNFDEIVELERLIKLYKV